MSTVSQTAFDAPDLPPEHAVLCCAATAHPVRGTYIAFVLRPVQGHRFALRRELPRGSHNAAELEAIVAGLEAAADRGVKRLDLFTSSRVARDCLVARRASTPGSPLNDLRRQARELTGEFSAFRCEWIATDWNEAKLVARGVDD